MMHVPLYGYPEHASQLAGVQLTNSALPINYGHLFSLGINPVPQPDLSLVEAHFNKQQHSHVEANATQMELYYAAAAANPFTAAAAVRLAAASPPMKRARVIVPPPASPIGSPRTVIAKSPSTPPARKPQGTVCLDDLHDYCSSEDIMICGNCREMFRSIGQLLHHKKEYCKLRFACKCSHETQQLPRGEEVSSMLLCGLCAEPFATAWHLIEHFQDIHAVDIYKLDGDQDPGSQGTSADRPCNEPDRNSRGASDDGISGGERESGSEGSSDGEDSRLSGGTPRS